MNNIEKFYLNDLTEIYDNFLFKFENELKKRIKNFSSKFNMKVDFKFDIKRDCSEKDTDLIITSITVSHNLNLFYFEIYLDYFNNDIKNYILADNILQLATIKNFNDENYLDFKANIKAELKEIEASSNNKVFFDVLTVIDIQEEDFQSNKSLLKIHFEKCVSIDKNDFFNELNLFYSKYNLKILYITNEIIFGSYLKNILKKEEFEEIKKIREINGSEYAIKLSKLKPDTRLKIASLIHKNSIFFIFNDK